MLPPVSLNVAFGKGWHVIRCKNLTQKMVILFKKETCLRLPILSRGKARPAHHILFRIPKHQEEKVAQSNKTNLGCLCMKRYLVKRSKLLVSLHDRVGYESRRDLVSTKPATVQTLDGFLGGFDRIKLDIDFTLQKRFNGKLSGRMWAKGT